MEKNLNLYFRGKFYFLRGNFQFGEIFVLGANFVLGGFFQFGQIGVWEILNIYFEGKSLFSYGSHYKLAQILTPQSVLINDIGYSVTTSKHIDQTTHATRHLTRFFSSEVFLKNALSECESLAKKIPFARSNKLNHINRIKSLFNKVVEFDQFCKENKISLHGYMLHKTNEMNTVFLHLKEKNISVYNCLAFPNFDKVVNSQNYELLEFMLGDIISKLSVFRTKLYSSVKCKKISVDGLKILKDRLDIYKN